MRPIKYKYGIVINEVDQKSEEKSFSAVALIEEIGGGKVEHNLPMLFGKDRVEAHDKMETLIRQWIQVNEK